MTDQTKHELQPDVGASLHTEENTALAPESGELSGVEKAKIIKYLQDHDYKVFTNEAYKEFMAQNKPIKEETTLSSPPFYTPHIPKSLKTLAFHLGSTYIYRYFQETLLEVMLHMRYENMR